MFRQPKEQGTGGGVIEFSPHLLDGLEMVEKRLYRLKNDYNTLKSSILKSYWDDKDRKQNRRSRSHRGRRIKKNIRSSIAKGFSL